MSSTRTTTSSSIIPDSYPLSVPVIAGAPNDKRWDKLFCPYVTRYDNNTPLEGSVAISFTINEDLDVLWKSHNGNHTTIAAHLKTVKGPPAYGSQADIKPLGDGQIKQVLSFMEFALGNQPFFFIRKGSKTIGLYRKTRNYYYDPEAGLRHRIGFEFVRLTTQEEEYSFRLAGQPPTVKMVTACVPAAK